MPLKIELNLIQGFKEPPCRNGQDNEQTKFEPFYFVQGADSQFGLIDNFIKKLENPGWAEEIKLAQTFIANCNKLEPKPKFVVVCGDLVDAMPGTKLRQPQEIDFKKVFSHLNRDIPMVCVCGNHDIGNEPTIEAITEYKREFGEDYFCFVVNEVFFIVINSQFYEHRANVEDYAKQHDQWLEDMLTKCKSYKYSIIFEHIPWFLKHFDEEDEYFNIKREIRLNWLRKFYEAGVTKIMCGHYHRNAGGWYKEMELVVTSAIGGTLGDDKSGARIVKVLNDKIEHKYHELREFPIKVDL